MSQKNKNIALSVHDVCMSFGTGDSRQDALRNIDLNVYSGEILMLRGPSGSGKTTLLSIMGGILTPTSGYVKVQGESMKGLNKKEMAAMRLKHMGFIFQEYNLLPTLDVVGNVMVALDLLGVHKKEARETASNILHTVGLGNKEEEYPSRLSGGQKQRLAIARALAGKPAVILADEPTAALDSENGALIMDLLKELAQKENRAVVIVTHDYRIQEAADRKVFIEDGRLFLAPEDKHHAE